MTHETSGMKVQRVHTASSLSLSVADIGSVGDLNMDQEAIFAQMEGTVLLYGQIIQLLHTHSANKYLAASSSEAAPLEQSCAKIFFRFLFPLLFPLRFSLFSLCFLRPNVGKKCWFKLLPVDESIEEGSKIPIGAAVYIAHANSDDMYLHRSNWADEEGDFEANSSPTPTPWIVQLNDTSGKRNVKVLTLHIFLFISRIIVFISL